MQPLLTAEEIRSLESGWINKTGSKLSLELMEKAGSALADLAKKYPEPYLIVCGKGNNGGDGIVATRYLMEAGKTTFLILTSNEDNLTNDAKVNFEKIKSKVNHSRVDSGNEEEFINCLERSNTIIDCILGTGAGRGLSDLYKNLVKKINDSGKIIIACDVPTGIDPTNGTTNGFAIKANVTATIGYPKLGLVVYPAKKFTGEIKVINIDLPAFNANSYLLDDDFVIKNLPKRYSDAHKGSFGRTLLVAGSKKYPGAAILAGRAASSIGSGLTSIASYGDVLRNYAPEIPEITHVDFNLDTIIDECKKSSVVVIGPGLTTDNEILKIVNELILNIDVPIVLDADGINVLSSEKKVIKSAKKETILTPHPKEFARLLGITTNEVLSNKVKLVRETSSSLNSTIVLKGPATLIGTKQGTIFVSPFANAALAKGGTGDVLSGFIGGLIAQGLSPEIAACVGVYIHGKTGEIISKEKTVFSLLPQDLIKYLPMALKTFV